MQLQEALDRFVLQLQANGRSRHTLLQYQRHVRALTRWLAQDGHTCEAGDIDHEVVARFLSAPVARTRSDGGMKKAGSVNALRSSLKGFFGYLHKAGYIPADPSRLVRRALCGTPPPRALSEDDQSRLLGALAAENRPIDRRDHALFHLMLASGIRVGSALALDVEDVALERREILLRCAKGNRTEVVYLGRKIRNHLREYIGDRLAGPLFRGRGDGRLSRRQAQKRFAMWAQIAGVSSNVTPHALRHSFATKLYLRTRDIYLVKQALGHRSIESTLRYAEQDGERLRRVLQA